MIVIRHCRVVDISLVTPTEIEELVRLCAASVVRIDSQQPGHHYDIVIRGREASVQDTDVMVRFRVPVHANQ